MMPEVTRIVTVPPPETLWRVDTEQPGDKWDSEHAKKTLYGTMEEKLGPKNQAGLFFFHSDSAMSLGCAPNMMRRHKKDRAWLTRGEAVEEIKLYDFSLARNIFQVLRGLEENGIDVMREDLFTFDDENGATLGFTRTFATFRTRYDELQKGINRGARGIELRQTSPDHVSTFGQVLTDFGNGPIFKKLVEESGLGLDGYRWREGGDPYGLTYCLFSSDKLSPPVQEEVTDRLPNHV